MTKKIPSIDAGSRRPLRPPFPSSIPIPCHFARIKAFSARLSSFVTGHGYGVCIFQLGAEDRLLALLADSLFCKKHLCRQDLDALPLFRIIAVFERVVDRKSRV